MESAGEQAMVEVGVSKPAEHIPHEVGSLIEVYELARFLSHVVHKISQSGR